MWVEPGIIGVIVNTQTVEVSPFPDPPTDGQSYVLKYDGTSYQWVLESDLTSPIGVMQA